MTYTLVPSLEHNSLMKIAVMLWNQNDIKALIAKFYYQSKFCSKRTVQWQEIKDKVTGKVPLLPLPERLKKEILCLSKPLGLQMLKWLEYHDKNCYLRIDVPSELCWTPQGTVDTKKTAEVLIKDESLDITNRYKLACIYCLEDDIPVLWNKIPESHRKSFYSEKDPRKIRQQELVVLWTYDIKGEVARMGNMIEKRIRRKCSPYRYAFEYAAFGGNKAATEHFLKKLTSREREESLLRSAGYVVHRRCDSSFNSTLPKKHYSDILSFLLSQMDEKQKNEVYESDPYEVLKCLLDWPWQNLFVETANHMWGFLSEENYDGLLSMIINKVIDGYKDCNYQKLFEEIWKKSPGTHKKYVIGKLSSGFLLFKLLKIKDKKSIRMILKDATPVEKKKIIFSDGGQVICRDLIYGDEWDFLKFFIRDCVSLKSDMVKFKEEFKERITWCCSKEEFTKKKVKWDKFFQLLDDFISVYSKRKCVEKDDSIPPKRLRCTEFEEILRRTL